MQPWVDITNNNYRASRMEVGSINFPSFESGDVKIALGASRVHRVESTVLRSAAQIGHIEMEQVGEVDAECDFGILFAKERAVSLSNKAVKKNITTRYHIVVTDVAEDESGRYRIQITQVALDEDGRPVENIKPYLGLETGQRTLLVFDAFTEILGSFYEKPIDLGGPNEPLRDRILYAWHMINLAEQLGVKHCIAPEVLTALRAQDPSGGSSLQGYIADDLGYWFEFSSRVRSRELYRETVIQAVGRFQTAKFKADIPSLSAETYTLVDQKATELKDRVKRLFHNILSYYPSELQRTAITGYADTDNIGRNSYSNDIFLWMALSIYRHCVSLEAFAAIDNEDMGYDLVVRIAKGGDKYCSLADCGPFFQRFPMTAKARDVINKKMKEIKDHVKPWAGILTHSYAEYGLNTGYFTCTNLAEDEYPFKEVHRD
jgi:hypothetical protein